MHGYPDDEHAGNGGVDQGASYSMTKSPWVIATR